MKKRLLYILSVMLLSACSKVSTDVQTLVIPYPQSVEMTETVFDKSNIDKIKYRTVEGMPAEAYELQIKKNSIIIKSSDDAGRFYAQQTLRQLAEAEVMHCGVIKDEPQSFAEEALLTRTRRYTSAKVSLPEI